MTLEAAIQGLQDENRDVRVHAVQTLGQLADPRAVRPMLALLGDTDFQVRRYLPRALAGIGPATIEPLLAYIAATDDPKALEAGLQTLVLLGEPARVALREHANAAEPRLRAAAVHVMGTSAATPLMIALSDEDATVRAAAAKRMGDLGGKWTQLPLLGVLLDDPDREVRQAAADALRRRPDESLIEPLIDAMRARTHNVHQIENILTAIGEPVIDPVAALYAEPLMRLHVVNILGNRKLIQREKSFGIILMACQDPDMQIRLAAVGKLSNRGGPDIIEPAIRAMVDEEQRVRRAGVRAIVYSPDPRLVEPLIARLDDHIDIAYSAARALGNIGTERARKALLRMLQSDYPRERRGAAEGLGKIHHPTVVEALLRALGDEDADVRSTVADSLAKHGDPRAVEPLLALAQSPDDDRSAMVRALVRLADARILQPFIGMVGDEEWQVRKGVADALGVVGDPRAAPALLTLLADVKNDVVSSAVWALAQIGGEDALRGAMDVIASHPSGYVRRKALSALGDLGDTRAVPVLIAALDDPDDHVPNVAAESLGRLRDRRGVKPLMAALQHADWHVRYAACWALGEIGHAEAGPSIIALLDDEAPQVRECAATALGTLKTGETALIRALQDDEWYQQYRLPHLLQMPSPADAPVWSLFIDLNLGIGNWGIGRVCDAAAGALRRLATPMARQALTAWETEQLPEMIAALGADRWEIRATAAKVLGFIGSKKAVEPLLKCLHDEQVDVRYFVAEALGRIGDPAAVPSLIPLLDDRTESVMLRVCDAAAQALQAIGTPAALEAVDDWEASRH